MENSLIPTNVPPNKKQNGYHKLYLRIGGIAIGLMAFSYCTVTVALAMTDPLKEKVELEAEYTDKLAVRNFLAEQYNQANKDLCLTEVKLANKKLELHHSLTEPLDVNDYPRIANKSQKTCEPQGEAPGL